MGKKARKEVWEAMRQERQPQQQLHRHEQTEVVPMEPSKFPRASMQKQGWLKLQRPGQFGWYRKSADGKDLIIYETFNGEDSLAYGWGYDLARKRLPRSFVEQVASDHGGLFARVLLKGFDDFYRPAKIERIRLDQEREAR